MGKIYENITELIGHTPLVATPGLQESQHLQSRLLVKLESFNPSGSVKDRAALAMIEAAEKAGILKPGDSIIEPTSGNTGIGIASIAASRGYHAVFTMPDSMSVERRKLLSAYGAEIVLTEGKLGMKGAIAEAERLQKEKGMILLGQFTNSANPEAHKNTTGPEIWEDTQGEIDILIAGVGTGGTLTGTGQYLKEKNPNLRVIAVEPDQSPVLSGGNPGPHGLMGIGAGFVPTILDSHIYDSVAQVSQEEAYAASRLLAEREGILVGISAGAALHCGILTAQKEQGKTIVVILPDTGERYLSTPLFL